MTRIVASHTMDTAEMRAAYAGTLIELADQNEKIVALEADLMGAGGMGVFQKAHPDRLFDVGIAEQSMVGMAAGLAVVGFVPFVHTFGTFATRRPCDQIYISCAYSRTNVKLVGSDPGITGALNGGTHQSMEDIALLRPIPNITILEPSDAVQLTWAICAAAETEGLFYIRMHRKPAMRVYEEGSDFTVGKGVVVRQGTDVTILVSGALMMEQALKAAEKLESQGITARIVDLVSIKPLDEELILRCAAETGAILVAENHFAAGGVASAVAEVLGEHAVGVPFRGTGIRDSFGEVGEVSYLLERFGMSGAHLAEMARQLVERKAGAK